LTYFVFVECRSGWLQSTNTPTTSEQYCCAHIACTILQYKQYILIMYVRTLVYVFAQNRPPQALCTPIKVSATMCPTLLARRESEEFWNTQTRRLTRTNMWVNEFDELAMGFLHPRPRSADNKFKSRLLYINWKLALKAIGLIGP
jgi:hypothetical protein